MKRCNYLPLFALAVFCLCRLAVGAPAVSDDLRLRFKVTLDSAYQGDPVAGRLLILMTLNRQSQQVIEPSMMNLRAVWICSQEVTGLLPGKSIELDPDTLAFPKPFSQAPNGNYQVMALLDQDHSYPYAGMGPGDLYSHVERLNGLWPVRGGTVELRLTEQVPEEHYAETATRKLATFRSPLMSAFWARPVDMRAGVILPPSYATSPTRKYPTVYFIHGFGSTHLDAWHDEEACCGPSPQQMVTGMASGKWPEMIYVFLDASCPMGHHVFADSVNTGPWGRALVEDFIPYLERTYRMEAVPASRFVTGHSSGGWASLWLQITHPDFFGGTWSTSPDAVDFRNWTGPDLTKTPPENFYHKRDGAARGLITMEGKDIITVEDFAHWEHVLGDYGGQLASFEAVYGPRGDSGRPMPLFDRDSGAINPFVQQAWGKYDISNLLKTQWPKLGPKLKGKLHIIVGTKDSIHLEDSVYLLRDRMKELGSDAQFTFLEGRTHFNVYEDGLAEKMAWEMYRVAHPKEGEGKK